MDFPCVAQGGLSGSVEYVNDSRWINQFRPDFVFFKIPAHVGLDQSQCPDADFRFGTGPRAGDRDITGAGPQYLAEFKLVVSADASGTFSISPASGTSLRDVNGVPISLHICHDRRYPELWTLPVMFGTRLILHPSNSGDVSPSRTTHTTFAVIRLGESRGITTFRLGPGASIGACPPLRKR